MSASPLLFTDLPSSETVKGLIDRIRALLKTGLGGDIVVRGVILGFRGSDYFDLQDEGDARLSLSCSYYGKDQVFAPLVSAGFPPQDGLPVMLRGRVTLSNARSQMRFVIESVVPQYTRAVLKSRRDETNERLTKEGLFESQRALKFPLLPRTLGLITSERGVVFNDVVKALSAAQFQFRYVWIRCGVQGAEAVREIPTAIEELSRHPAVDVICVFRGGGSAMELDAFNSYEIARAVCMSPKPVLCAIGHKPDECSAQDVAFKNCHTPSLMGEFLVKRIDGLRQRVESWTGVAFKRLRELHTSKAKAVQFTVGMARERLSALIAEKRSQLRIFASAIPVACARRREQTFSKLRLLVSGIPSGLSRVRNRRETDLQHMAERIRIHARATLRTAGRRVNESSAKVSPRVRSRLARAKESFLRSRSWIVTAQAFVRAMRANVQVHAARMAASDPQLQLRRGFAIVRGLHGTVITTAAALDCRPDAVLQMRDGSRKISVSNLLLS